MAEPEAALEAAALLDVEGPCGSDDDDDDAVFTFSLRDFLCEARGIARDIGLLSLIFAAAAAGCAAAFALVWHPAYSRGRPPRVATPTRYLPSEGEQVQMRDRWAYAVHEVDYQGAPLAFVHGERGSGGARAGGGHARLPRRFYDAATFGVASSGDTFDEDPGAHAKRLADLSGAVHGDGLRPRPSRVLPWSATLAGVDGAVDGFMLQYDLADLARHASWRRGNGTDSSRAMDAAERAAQAQADGAELPEWYDAQADVEAMARHLGKVFILSWTPDHFGERHKIDDLRHCHVLQRISPLRSGLQHLRAAGVVWIKDNATDARR